MPRIVTPLSLPPHQRGVTLVSLMVGMALSLVVVTAMLLVFRSVTRTTLEARQGAGWDGQLTSASLAAGSWLQEVGFGVADARVGQQLLVIRDAGLQDGRLTGSLAASTSPRTGNALVWERRVGGVLQCSGLYAPTTGGLRRLQPATCTSAASAWNTLTWVQAVVYDTAGPATSFRVDDVAEAAACGPFGIATGKGRARVLLSTANSAGVPLVESQCLFNLVAAGV